MGRTKKKSKVSDHSENWELGYKEPKLLEIYDDILSLRINYKISYIILSEIIIWMGLDKQCLEVILAKRCHEMCGQCVYYKGDIGKDCYDIVIYKGYYTLGVLLHEFTHAINYEKYGEDLCNDRGLHGYHFKY